MGREKGSGCGWVQVVVLGKCENRNGIGILVDRELREQVVEVRRVNNTIMEVKLVASYRG